MNKDEVNITELFVKSYSQKLSHGESQSEKKSDSSEFSRLVAHIKTITIIANQYHEDKHFKESKNALLMKKSCLNNITRISLSEFFLYTQMPLTLKEFSELISKIEDIAKQCHENLHLLLATFAIEVTTRGFKEFVNYAVYVQCGQCPIINTFAKTVSSNIDVGYEEFSRFRRSTSFNRKKSNESIIASLPENKEEAAISQQPMIVAKTAGGVEFLVLVEICLEHKWERVKQIFENLLQSNDSNYILSQVSHVITSNKIKSKPQSMICYAVTHANTTFAGVSVINNKDPILQISVPQVDLLKYESLIKKHSPKMKLLFDQDKLKVRNPPFGSNYYIDFYPPFGLFKYGLKKELFETVCRINEVRAFRNSLTYSNYGLTDFDRAFNSSQCDLTLLKQSGTKRKRKK